MSNTKKSDRKDVECDYEVGYGKPPTHTRFRSGQSGNPKGRPKGVRNFKTDVKATLKAPVKLTRDGKPRKVSTQAAMLLRLREKALSGDPRALGLFIGLAQTYNNEELIAAAGASADDATLLEIFTTRLLSGAAGRPDAADGKERCPEGVPVKGSERSGHGAASNTKQERVRLTRPGCYAEPAVQNKPTGKRDGS